MRVPGLIFIAVLLALTPVMGQIGRPQQGSILGVVRDSSGVVLSGVTVTVMGGAIDAPERRTVITDREGRYTVGNLLPGTYAVTFELPGFATITSRDVFVKGIGPATLETVMRVAALQETISPGPRFRLGPVPQAPRDTRAECLHGPNETEPERERRLEAFNAMHLIYSVLEKVPTHPTGRGYPDWQTLARTSAVAALKKRGGTTGELANKIQWGTAEPLPGWRIRYLYGMSVEYALTDVTDECRFTLSSNDPRVIPPTARTMPLGPHSTH